MTKRLKEKIKNKRSLHNLRNMTQAQQIQYVKTNKTTHKSKTPPNNQNAQGRYQE